MCVSAFSAIAQEVTVDMRYNVLASESERDFFNWSIGSKNVKDGYDARTGASIARSTREFDAAVFDAPSTRRLTIPIAIRHLLLFPLASRRYAENFYLTVQEEGQRLRIRFIVYGTVFQILTDERKRIDVSTACSSAENITLANSLSSPVRPEYTLPGADPKIMTSIDWSKINLVRDNAANASRRYSGFLTVGYTNGILTVNGTLSS
jgi:hypothetical protein